jgi:hypothetical protein
LEKHLNERAETQAFRVTDGMINDWPGSRYLTTHRCFGNECPDDKFYDRAYVQLDEMPHAYGNFHQERDQGAGYPKEYNADKDMVKMVKAHIAGETGAFITPYDVQNKLDAEQE